MEHPENLESALTSAVRAAAEGAASGTASLATGIGELRGAVLARLDEGNRRMGDMHGDVKALTGRLDEISDRVVAHEQRIGALEAGRKSVSTWLRDGLGWLVAAGAGAMYLLTRHGG